MYELKQVSKIGGDEGLELEVEASTYKESIVA